MNKLLPKVLGVLIIVTSIISPMSAFGMESDPSQLMAVSDSTVSEAVYATPIVTPVENSDDHGDNFATATELALNADGVGQISSSSDIDFFKFTTDASEGEYFVEVSGTGAGSMTTYDSTELDCGSGTFDSENNYSYNVVIRPGETYYLAIKSDESNISYKVKVNKWTDDYGYNKDSAKELALNTEISGKINYINDTDYFKITTDTKGIYSLDCSGAGNALVLFLDSNGYMLNSGSFSADKSYCYDLSLNANETYYLLVVSSDSGMSYKVKMTRELLQNPSFTDNTAGWYFWTQDGAVASGTRDTTVYESVYGSVYGSSDAAYKIDCTSKGSALNHIQLFTSGLKVEAGKTYKLSFMAKSEGGNANPLIALMQKSSPWAYYAKSSTVTIDSEWKLFNVYFTSNKTDNDARLSFFLGNRMPEGGKLYFDSLSFKECSELLVNQSFEKGVGSWYMWTQSGATAIGTRDIGVFDSSPAGYRINCTTKGTDVSHIQLMTWGIKVNEGKRYRLLFRAKSEGGKVTPLVRLMQKDSPWKSYAASNQVSIGSGWNTYEVYFDCNTTDSNARLTFFLGNSMADGSKLYLDSMSMVEVIK